MQPRSRSIAHLELAVVTGLSALFHFWRLFTPRAVVFDELHYEHFTGYYLSGRYMFDVHPPLGRLMLMAVGKMAGPSADSLVRGEPAPVLRILPALFGTLLVPLVYIIMRQLSASRRAATLAPFAVL